MAVDNSLNGSEANTGTFKRVRLMETLKYAKQFVYILHIKASSVVSYKHHYLICVPVGAAHLDFGPRPCARELDSIGKKIY